MKSAFSLLFVIIIFFSVSCSNTPGDELRIPVEVELTDISPGATDIKILAVEIGTLKTPVTNPNVLNTNEKKRLETGDLCIIVSVEFKNNTDNDTIVLLRSDGFDADGIQRSWVLDPGPIVGLAYYNTLAQSTTHVDIPMNWEDDLALIRINATVQHEIFKLPGISTTPDRVETKFPVQKLEQSLEKAGKTVGIEIPWPHYLPEGYELSTNIVTENEYVEMVISNSKNSTKLVLLWRPSGAIPYRVDTAQDTVDINGIIGQVISMSDSGYKIIWNWYPEKYKPGLIVCELFEPKSVPLEELTAIASSISWD
jgi:hypothetical protein